MARLVSCSLAFLAACGSGAASPAAAPPPPPPVVVDAAPPPPDAPPPPPPTHTIVKGDTLDAIAKERYGSRHYSDLLELVDHVSPTKLRVGASLALPSIAELAAPIAVKAPDATAALLRAHAAWDAARAGLWEAHAHGHVAARDDLARAAADVRAARDAFAKAGAPTKQLEVLAGLLASVGAGKIDRDGYDLDELDRRCDLALVALVKWAR